jgi:hypothetical protein
MIMSIPARKAARLFSFRPPMGNMRPRNVISPVIATSERTGLFMNSEATAVNIATPAEGPSFGTAPADTWTWMSFCLNASAAMPSFSARVRTRLSAACTDSFITSPIWPVSVTLPEPA